MSVKTDRFKFNMDNQGLSYASFETASLTFSIFATLLLIPDIMFYFYRNRALELGVPPPPSAEYVTIAVSILEDIPQFILGCIYLRVNDVANEKMCDRYKKGVDGLALFSLLLSLFAIAYNILQAAKPEWFYRTKDEHGKAIAPMADPIAKGVGSIKRRAGGSFRKSFSEARTVENPMYDANATQYDEPSYITVDAVPVDSTPAQTKTKTGGSTKKQGSVKAPLKPVEGTVSSHIKKKVMTKSDAEDLLLQRGIKKGDYIVRTSAKGNQVRCAQLGHAII